MKALRRSASAPGEGPRAWRALRTIVAVFALIVLLASGASAGDSAFPYDQGGGGLSSARFAVGVLEPGARDRNLALPPDPARLRELILQAREGGLDPRNIVESIFPRARSVIALLSVERDMDDFERDTAGGGAAGKFYGQEILLAHSLQPLFRPYVELFTAAYEELGGPLVEASLSERLVSRLRNGVLPYRSETGIVPPPRYQLADAHPYALDLFFTELQRLPDGHKGPVIPSLSGGIVVASARDWRGGAGIEAWRGGGLTPSAGNGVVVFDPVSQRFFSYFHLRTTTLRPGDIVRPGSPLGIGGNTGMNARRPGHGGHVHVEIFDVAADKSLNSYRILDLVTGR